MEASHEFWFDHEKLEVYRVRPVNHVFQADRGRGMMFGAPS